MFFTYQTILHSVYYEGMSLPKTSGLLHSSYPSIGKIEKILRELRIKRIERVQNFFERTINSSAIITRE